MTSISDLIERVRAAEGPDRELDVALLILWQPGHEALRSYDERYETELRDGTFSVWRKGGGYSASVTFPRFTASIDAALSLAERVLPGWRYELSFMHDEFLSPGNPPYSAALLGPCREETLDGYPEITFDSHSGRAKTLCLAIVLATLTALQQQAEQTGDVA